MPRRSTFELHPDGPELEQKLLNGEITGVEVARRLGITESAVSQHKKKLSKMQENAPLKNV